MYLFQKGRGANKILLMCFVLVMVLSMSLYVGCAPDAPDDQEEKVLRIIYETTNDIDPLHTTLYSQLFRVYQIMNGLVKMDYETGEPIPDLAESWVESEDRSTITFKLRKGVQFHRGYGEMTAHDVAFTVNKILDPEVGSGKRPAFQGVEIEVIDDYTIKFTFPKPSPYYLIEPFGIPRLWVMSEKAYEDLGPEKHGKQPIGTGPYMFEEYLVDEKLVLTKFPDYFEGPANIDRIEMVEIPEATIREIALQQGEVDVLHYVTDGDMFNRLLSAKDTFGLKMFQPTGGAAVRGLQFNLTIKPYDDVRVRHAVAHLIDNEAYVEKIIGIGGLPATTLWQGYPGLSRELPRGFPSYPYDPQRAKELLDRAGVTDLGIAITSAGQYHNEMVLTLLQDEARKIGVKLEVQFLEGATFVQLRNDNQLSLTTFGFGVASILYPRLYAFCHSDNFPPRTNRANYDECDDLIEQAGRELDDAKRAALYERIRWKMMEDLPYYPTYNMASPSMMCQSVMGWKDILAYNHPLHLYDIDLSVKKSVGR